MVVIIKMNVLSSLKKLNKNYSVVIVPHTNDSVRRLAVKAPLVKLLLMVLILSVFSAFLFIHEYRGSAQKHQAEQNSGELEKQIKSLNDIISAQNEALSMSKSQLEQAKKENAKVKSNVEEFTKLYENIAEDYISKTSRGASAAKNSTSAVLDLSKLSTLVKELNKGFTEDGELAAQLRITDRKLEKYIGAIPTFLPATGSISSPFGMRTHPIQKVYKIHEGVDITSSKGDPIYAAASGVVEFAGYSSGYGYNVKIDHQNGIRTIYAHSSRLLVKKGEKVEKGQKIALVGSTGNSTGPHLHFEIRIGNTPVDPTGYLDFTSVK
ncbi:M23 family metallopeptidase [Ruminiclostridium hungatei]|nr:M23 family metallopeptidase [Ruminiclostridium hungatei]